MIGQMCTDFIFIYFIVLYQLRLGCYGLCFITSYVCTITPFQKIELDVVLFKLGYPEEATLNLYSEIRIFMQDSTR